jgi:hypothetical protein
MMDDAQEKEEKRMLIHKRCKGDADVLDKKEKRVLMCERRRKTGC